MDFFEGGGGGGGQKLNVAQAGAEGVLHLALTESKDK